MSHSPPPDLKPPRVLIWLVVVGMVSGVLLMLLFLPLTPLTGLILAGLIGTVLVTQRRHLHLRHWLRTAGRLLKTAALGRPPDIEAGERAVERVPPLRTAAEIALVIAAGVVIASTDSYLDKPVPKLRGWEAEWLTSSAYYAAQSLREYGYLPLWQPWLEWGEPLIESPFSFALNPISAGPSLLFGGLDGIRISIVLYAVFAGLGGWFLGRVLGMAGPARLLLALLMIGKGNMHAMIGTGFYQLGVSQAYFPWVFGAALAVFRFPSKRWPVVLLAVMLTLMFWAGNVWYLLPTIMGIVLLALLYGWILPRRFDRTAFKRLALAGALSAGLSAVTLLPMWANRDHIGRHPDELQAGAVVDWRTVVPLYFDGDRARLDRLQVWHLQFERFVSAPPQFYYTFAVPLWFVALVFVVFPPFLHRSGSAPTRGVWIGGLLLIVMATIWGAGGNPVLIWMYEHVPLLGQWRFVGRALAVASFWIGVLVALRVDGLWRFLRAVPVIVGTQHAVSLPKWHQGLRFIKSMIAAGLVVAGGLAAYEVNRNWGWFSFYDPVTYRDGVCVTWLRQQNPDKQLTLYRGGYDAITTFLDNHVRKFNIEADYEALPDEPTLGKINLVGYGSLPEYGLPWENNERVFLWQNGYRPVSGSQLIDRFPCIWRKADALTYAYTIPLDVLESLEGETLDSRHTTPVTTFERLPDQMRVIINGHETETLVLTLQELAYPGWIAEVDGQPAKLESVGGQIGVILPPGKKSHFVYFAYRPPLFFIGAAITLLTWVFCVGYVLGVLLRKVNG